VNFFHALYDLSVNFFESEAKTTGEKLKEAFKETEGSFQIGQQFEDDKSGTTAVVAVVDPSTRKVNFAHCGDSRAVLLRGKNSLAALLKEDVSYFATEDHTPKKEKKRIRGAGGKLAKLENILRVKSIYGNEGIAVSRAIGDRFYPGVIADPDVDEMDIQSGDVIILASNGFWRMARKMKDLEKDFQEFDEEKNLQKLAKKLTDKSYNAWKKFTRCPVDNITVMIVRIGKGTRKIEKQSSENKSVSQGKEKDKPGKYFRSSGSKLSVSKKILLSLGFAATLFCLLHSYHFFN